MLALPLKLEGPQIIDANSKMIALVRGDMAEYRARGKEIVAAVNGFAKLPDLLESSAREAIKHPLALLDKFEEHYTRLCESSADLLAAAKDVVDHAIPSGNVRLFVAEHRFAQLKSAIAKAEKV